MLSARIAVGFCIFTACAAADDSTTHSYLNSQLRNSYQPPLTLFDGTFTLAPVKQPARLLPVQILGELKTSRGGERSPIQQMSYSTSSNSELIPIDTVYVESGSHGPISVDTHSTENAPLVPQQNAELASNADLLRRIKIQDQQIAALQSQFYSSAVQAPTGRQQQHFSYGCSDGCGEHCRDNCQRDCGWLCERRGSGPRLIGGVEVPFLRSRLSGAIPVFNVGAAAEQMIDSSFAPALRYHLELQTSKSHSLRASHFRYDHSFPFRAPYQPAELGIRINQTDVEAVFRHHFDRWSFDISGGIEHARLEYQAELPTAVGVGTASFEGVGPVFAMNAAHDIADTNLSWFVGVRGSMLMGSINNATLLVNVPQSKILDETMQVYSNQLGVQWAPLLTENVGLTVRAAWETQYWVNSTFSDDALGIGSNLNLTGPTISAEIDY